MFSPSAARTRYYSYVVPDSTACVAVISRTSSTIPALPTLSRAYFTASLKVSVAVTVALVIVDVNWNGRVSKRARTNSRNVHGVLLITPVLV